MTIRCKYYGTSKIRVGKDSQEEFTEDISLSNNLHATTQVPGQEGGK
jgi:hypothetical protein